MINKPKDIKNLALIMSIFALLFFSPEARAQGKNWTKHFADDFLVVSHQLQGDFQAEATLKLRIAPPEGYLLNLSNEKALTISAPKKVHLKKRSFMAKDFQADGKKNEHNLNSDVKLSGDLADPPTLGLTFNYRLCPKGKKAKCEKGTHLVQYSPLTQKLFSKPSQSRPEKAKQPIIDVERIWKSGSIKGRALVKVTPGRDGKINMGTKDAEFPHEIKVKSRKARGLVLKKYAFDKKAFKKYGEKEIRIEVPFQAPDITKLEVETLDFNFMFGACTNNAAIKRGVPYACKVFRAPPKPPIRIPIPGKKSGK